MGPFLYYEMDIINLQLCVWLGGCSPRLKFTLMPVCNFGRSHICTFKFSPYVSPSMAMVTNSILIAAVLIMHMSSRYLTSLGPESMNNWFSMFI